MCPVAARLGAYMAVRGKGAGRTAGDDSVNELFAEFEVPVFKGLPGIESLDFQASGRYTDYDSYGEGSTYKVGVNWQITPDWRVRASKGTSFRAPALYELYLANQTSFTNQGAVDPCIDWGNSTNPQIRANCAAVGVPFDYTAAGTSSALVTTGGWQAMNLGSLLPLSLLGAALAWLAWQRRAVTTPAA